LVLMLAEIVLTCGGCALSVACKVNEEVPVAPTVPLITPVEPLSVSPVGSVPAVMAHVRGAAPPEADNVARYGTFWIAFGSVVEVMDKTALTFRESASVAVCAGAELSETLTVKFAAAATVGIPESTPLEERETPRGRAPALTDQVKGATPPVAASVVLRLAPMTVSGRVIGVMASAALTVIADGSVAIRGGFAESVTWTVKLFKPAVVAVPDMAPVEAFSDKPSGRVPALTDQLSGATPPEAERVVEKGKPITALGRVVPRIESTGLMVMLAGNVALCGGVEESPTRKVKLEVPTARGAPVMAPVAPFKRRPDGNAPCEMVQVSGAVPPATVGVKT
jgi:hypothetical protein